MARPKRRKTKKRARRKKTGSSSGAGVTFRLDGKDDMTILDRIVVKGVRESLIQRGLFDGSNIDRVEALLFQDVEVRVLGNVLIIQGRPVRSS
jgi:hypothetical protein